MKYVLGKIYTLRELLALDLPDTPNLGFTYPVGGEWQCVQNSHLTNEELLSVPGMADTQWRLLRITSEWIPVCVHVGGPAIEDCVDIEIDPDGKDQYWVTPKGFPRENPAKLDWSKVTYYGW